MKTKYHADGLEFWKAKDGWRVWSKGRITAESGEAYKRRLTMLRSMNNAHSIIGDYLANLVFN